jgi:hypothetical protein
VEGPDGSRVPLLRAGFRPSGAYTVSFVFLHSGAPFTKKGAGVLTLPKMDVPVGVVQWEVFLPKQYAVAAFGGDAIPANLMPAAADLEEFAELRPGAGGGGNLRVAFPNSKVPIFADSNDSALVIAGQLGGYVLDPAGAAVRGATVVATNVTTGTTRTAFADASGKWVLSGMPAGVTRVTVSARGLVTQARTVELRGSGSSRLDTSLQVGSTAETVEVRADAIVNGSVSGGLGGRGGAGGPGGGNTLSTQSSRASGKVFLDQNDLDQKTARQQAATKDAQTSQNVLDLQKRVAGVLPIAVNVPHAGNSYRFVRPLVVDEETRVTFNYRIGKVSGAGNPRLADR